MIFQWKTVTITTAVTDDVITLPITMTKILNAQGQMVYASAATDDGATPHVMVTRYAAVFTSISKSSVTLRKTQKDATYKIFVIGYLTDS